MKLLILILGLALLSGCSEKISAGKVEAKPAPTAANSNPITVGNLTPLSKEESEKIDKAAREEIEIQKEKLKNVPDELKNADFKNFSYPTKENGTIRLRDGNFKIKNEYGGTSFGMREIYYADLTGDRRKEAIVELFVVSCGGSCDGGSSFLYAYTVRRKKPALIWHFESGSYGYGCGLKNFVVKDGQINLDAFGRCDIKKNALEAFDNSDCGSKYSCKNETQLVFAFDGSKIAAKKKTFQILPEQSVLNYDGKFEIID